MYCRCTLLALTRAAVAYRTRRYNLCYMMGNAAPKLRSRFSSPASLPFILLEDNAELQRVLGPAAEDWRSVEWSRKLLTEDDAIYVVHKDFNVLAVTRFEPVAYEGHLKKELPLESMQHIKVTKE